MTQRWAVKYYLKVTRKRFSNNGLLVRVRRFIRGRIPRKKSRMNLLSPLNQAHTHCLHTPTHKDKTVGTTGTSGSITGAPTATSGLSWETCGRGRASRPTTGAHTHAALKR